MAGTKTNRTRILYVDCADPISDLNSEMLGSSKEEIIVDYKMDSDQLHSGDNNIDPRKCMWQYNHTLLLISIVNARYEDMEHVTRKKTVWSSISEDLASYNIHYNSEVCKKKWLNLIRTYKSVRENKIKTGKCPTRFLFYDEIDAIIGDNPKYSSTSPHSLDEADTKPSTANAISDEEPSTGMEQVFLNEEEEISHETSPTERVRKNVQKKRDLARGMIQVKKKYYQFKQEATERKNQALRQHLHELRKLKERHLVFLEKKLKLEERKVKALEKLAMNC